MFKYLKIILMMFLLMCFQNNILVKASTGTSLSGIISQDTILTQAGSPYTLTGDIQIANGVKLTIEPGVTIEGNNNRIRDFGDFEAIGSPDSKIIINNVNIEPGAGSPSEQYLIHIENADIINGSLYRPTGNAIYGSLILKDSRLFNLSNYLYLWYPTSDIYIERNAFINSGGISVGTSDGVKVHILNNVFYNFKNFAVQNWASYGTSETIVSYNSFLNPNDNLVNALVLPAGYSSANMTATNNYWGTTDETDIGNMIYDKNDDLSSATYINFKPYLQSPDANTPIIDTVSPEKPIVDEVTEKSEYITGNAEKFSTINVVNENNDNIGETTADANGDFKININPLNAGSKLFVTATDDWFNRSEPTIVIVKDVTPPNSPKVNDITDQSTSVTGTAEAGSTITVTSNGTVLGTTVTDNNGNFTLTIPVQKAGTTITVTATDNAGNISEATGVTVKDVTPPSAPTVNQVTDQSTSVTGTAEAGSTITVTSNGTVLGTTVNDNNGNFTLTIPVQKAGTTISVTATDNAGNTSEATGVTVKDVTPPSAPTVNQVTDQSTSVTGAAEVGSTITVKAGNNVVGTAITKSSGTFLVSIPFQKAGTALSITVTDNAGNVSVPTSITVIAKFNGWVVKGGQHYYYVNNVVQKGWLSLSDKKYYLDPTTGAMKTGWVFNGDRWYFLNKTTGVRTTGWVLDGKWYFLNPDGSMKTGWLYYGGNWYFLNPNGSMVSGWVYTGGKWYYMYSSGIMAHDTKIGSYRIGHDGAWIH